ncbi:hypothetical protein FAZ79_00540 [Guyparkeria sp. SB14A]|uniref:hypothetical protein n=1 Tax=Guyparkeria sp. SB14A TaxID=2571147 RepID=UPI0010AD9E56|nr:hypothetical protein [Guyparkeria sp. SB14A]TKA91827.1 hypothetical protein FAZ79_00540 [Guyparkeria sp. SB14A]
MIEWATFTVSIPYPSADVVWQVFLWWSLAAVIQLIHFQAYLLLWRKGGPAKATALGVLVVAALAPVLMVSQFVLPFLMRRERLQREREMQRLDKKLGGKWADA